MINSLKRYIEENKYTQQEVADEIGVHKSTIKRVLGTMTGGVSIFTELKIAKFLDSKVIYKSHNIDNINTKHYSNRAHMLTLGLVDVLDKRKDVIEPFTGGGALLNICEQFNSVEKYDIVVDMDSVEERDTLLNPPVYKNKYVITNPPYLARNKANDKSIFDLYKVDDLYKAFIISLIQGNVEGGLIIIPLNFITDENSKDVRDKFFSKYKVLNMNIFKCQMFDNTKYNTCSFNFIKGETSEIECNIISENEELESKIIKLDKENNWRLFGSFYKSLEVDICVNRYTSKEQNATDIIVNCLDGTLDASKIKAIIGEKFIGKNSDRASFTLVSDRPLDVIEQIKVVERFNSFINCNREKYHNLLFTNFRENNRKRIGFDLAYKIISKIILEVKNEK